MKLKPGVHTHYIRRADLPDILEIEQLSFLDPWTETDFLTALRRKEVLAVCVRLNYKLAGFMVYRIERDAFYILRIAVTPSARRQGVGRTLISRAKARLFGDRTKLRVLVPETNMPALRFFLACELKGVRVHYNRDGCDDFEMEYLFV